MKKYTIVYNYIAASSVEVLANSMEEAYRKASKISIPYEDLDLDLDNKEIVEAEDVPDLNSLIEQAEDILKEAQDNDADIILNPWPLVTLEVWDGNRMLHRKERIELLYWDFDCNEIGFNTEESCGDHLLSELPEIEQLEICESIIKAK